MYHVSILNGVQIFSSKNSLMTSKYMELQTNIIQFFYSKMIEDFLDSYQSLTYIVYIKKHHKVVQRIVFANL